MDGSPPGSAIPGILQARTLEWVAISFSNAWKWKVKVKSLSHVWLLVTPWTVAHQAPPSMGFSRREYWSGVPLPSTGELASFCYFSKDTWCPLYWNLVEEALRGQKGAATKTLFFMYEVLCALHTLCYLIQSHCNLEWSLFSFHRWRK